MYSSSFSFIISTRSDLSGCRNNNNGLDVYLSEDAGLYTTVDILDNSAHDLAHLGVLLGHVDAVQKVARLHHCENLKHEIEMIRFAYLCSFNVEKFLFVICFYTLRPS